MNSKIPGRLFQILLAIFFSGFAISCIYPFYYMLLYSVSDPVMVAKTNMYLLPVGFSLNNYMELVQLKGLTLAFLVSLIRTILGTFLTVFASSLFAYALTKKQLPGRNLMYRTCVISMYVNAGLIPWYIVMLKLGMKNNYLLYILPGAVSVFFVILIKTYMEQLPASLEESAHIDGAGVLTIYTRIILPLCTPILAAVAVFSAVGQWNSWADNFFLVRVPELQTLQLMLLNYLRQAENLAAQARSGGSYLGMASGITPLSVKMTLTIIVALPIIMVYPFMQKYFVKGILIGAIKG